MPSARPSEFVLTQWYVPTSFAENERIVNRIIPLYPVLCSVIPYFGLSISARKININFWEFVWKLQSLFTHRAASLAGADRFPHYSSYCQWCLVICHPLTNSWLELVTLQPDNLIARLIQVERQVIVTALEPMVQLHSNEYYHSDGKINFKWDNFKKNVSLTVHTQRYTLWNGRRHVILGYA